MTGAYLFRLVCLSLAAFFVVHLVLGVTVRLASRIALAHLSRIAPFRAANLLFAFRLTPPVLAVVFVAAFCIPSYLKFEPAIQAESVGEACLTAAILAVLTLAVSLGRGVRATIRSSRFVRHCRQQGRDCRVGDTSVSVIDRPPLCLALVGVLKPRIVVSGRILRALSHAQFSAAVRHEQAHSDSRDNLKRLVMLLSPDLVPFAGGLRALERQWVRMAEYAADDRAVAGNPQHSLSLASALVRVARLGSSPVPLSASLIDDGQEIMLRVERLLHPVPAPATPTYALTISAAVLAGALAVLAYSSQTAAMLVVHRMLELLMD